MVKILRAIYKSLFLSPGHIYIYIDFGNPKNQVCGVNKYFTVRKIAGCVWSIIDNAYLLSPFCTSSLDQLSTKFDSFQNNF